MTEHLCGIDPLQPCQRQLVDRMRRLFCRLFEGSRLIGQPDKLRAPIVRWYPMREP